jgi:hypothetical protein
LDKLSKPDDCLSVAYFTFFEGQIRFTQEVVVLFCSEESASLCLSTTSGSQQDCGRPAKIAVFWHKIQIPLLQMTLVHIVASFESLEEGCHSAEFHTTIHVQRQFTTTDVNK